MKTSKERLAVMESDIAWIKEDNKKQNIILEKLDKKFDKVIEIKADKSEVKILSDKVNKWIYAGVCGLVIILIGVTGFLLKFVLFTN